MQVHSNTRRPLFGLTKTFHVGGSTLRKLSHHAESSTTFNYFTQRSQVCKKKKKISFRNSFPHHTPKTVCVNESRGGICREGKIPDLSQADTSYY